MRSFPALFGCALLGLTLSGCVNLEPSADPTRFYVLHSGLSDAPATDETSRVLTLQEVRLPSYLQGSKIAVHGQGFGISYSDWHRWGEELDVGLTRVLAEYLNASLPSYQVDTGRRRYLPAGAPVLEVEIERFEGTQSGEVWVAARYIVTEEDSQGFVAQGHFRHRAEWDGSDYQQLVAALSDGLRQLASEIASKLGTE
ncbi:MAG: PqiC family protein [Verrucomicrobiota bacterium JB022]|nr:PqiC family protein [Verrucomicrobiota bacterium JB022]